MINATGKKILNEINKVTKQSQFGTYISVSVFKDCVRKYCSAVDVTVDKMVEKRYAFYSKSGKAITLSKGLIDGFTPYTCDNVYECQKFAERFADEAVADFGVITNKEWLLKYGFNALYVHSTRKPTSTLWTDLDKIAENKYHHLDLVMEKQYYPSSTQYKLKCQKQEQEQKEFEEYFKQENQELQAKKDSLKYITEFCVCFDQYYDWTEVDGGEVINYNEPTKDIEFIRYFNTLEEAQSFAKHIAEYSYNTTEDGFCDYWEYEYHVYTYKVVYCGRTSEYKIQGRKPGLYEGEMRDKQQNSYEMFKVVEINEKEYAFPLRDDEK